MKIFISYSKKDKKYMKKIEQALFQLVLEEKISLWIDKDKLNPSERFDKTISKEIRKANIVFLLLSINFRSSEYISKKELPFIFEEYRSRGMMIFPIVLKDTQDLFFYKELEGVMAAPFLDDNLTPINDFKVKDKAYNYIAKKVEEVSQKLLKNPYKHLSYFETKDKDLFFGRDKLSKQIATTVLNLKAALVFGESGVGKTSLLLAGVFPILKRKDDFIPVYIRCKSNIFSYMEELLAKELRSKEILSIEEMLKNYIERYDKKVLLIFDQFEELFTTVSTHERDKFFNTLLVNLKAMKDVHMLFSLRADFFWCLSDYRDKFDELWTKAEYIPRLKKDEVMQAITYPLSEGEISDNLADRIYGDLLVIKNSSQHSDDRDVYTPFLQLVMYDLYSKALSNDSIKITDKLYDKLGGASSIILNYLDGLLKKFNPDEHLLLEKLFFYLVTDEYTRDTLSKKNFESVFKNELEDAHRLIKELIKDRVVKHITDTQEYYELVHDVLALEISKRYNLRQNIKHLNTRLNFFEAEEKNNKVLRYFDEREVYEFLLSQEMFLLNKTQQKIIIRSGIRHNVFLNNWILKDKQRIKILSEVLIELLNKELDQNIFVSASKVAVEYFDVLNKATQKRITQVFVDDLDELQNHTEAYATLNFFNELNITPTKEQIEKIKDIALNYNLEMDIREKAVLVVLKNDFEDEEFMLSMESEIINDFLVSNSNKKFVKDIIYIYIEKMGVKKYLKKVAEIFQTADVELEEDDDDILFYNYLIVWIEYFLDYIKDFEDNNIDTNKIIKSIINNMTKLFFVLKEKSYLGGYEELGDKVEAILLDERFGFELNVALDGFIYSNHPVFLSNNIFAKKIAKNLSTKELERLLKRLDAKDEVLKSNVYKLLKYRFSDVVKIDAKRFENINSDEVNMFTNYQTSDKLLENITIVNKDIYIKNLEANFDESLAINQLELWEKSIDKKLKLLSENTNTSLKNIMVGSFEMQGRSYEEITMSLQSFFSFFSIEGLLNKLHKNFMNLKSFVQTEAFLKFDEELSKNITHMITYIDMIKVDIEHLKQSQMENRITNANGLEVIVNKYEELHSKISSMQMNSVRENLSETLQTIKNDLFNDKNFITLYIEAKNVDIELKYFVDYITDLVYMVVKNNDKESLVFKKELLQKLISLQRYDDIKTLFKNIVSIEKVLDEESLKEIEKYKDAIKGVIFEAYLELKKDIPLYYIDKNLHHRDNHIRTTVLELLVINSSIDNEIKKERAFKALGDKSLMSIALAIFHQMGSRQDILRLVEYRDTHKNEDFQNHLTDAINMILKCEL